MGEFTWLERTMLDDISDPDERMYWEAVLEGAKAANARAEKAERERDEARREAERWRARWLSEHPGVYPDDESLPWEREEGDGG